MFKYTLILVLVASAAHAAAAAPPAAGKLDDSHIVAAAFGAGSSEAFAVVDNEITSSYDVGFRLGVDFYRNDGRVTHLVTFNYAGVSNYYGNESFKDLDFNYNIPIYFTMGRLRPAVRPFFGGHFFTGEGGGSQGQLGILGGARFIIKPCNFSDIYFGWRGRYRALPTDGADEPEGWKSSFILRNANTIHIYGPACIYVTAAVDFDLTKYAAVRLSQTRKPAFAFAGGPAIGW